MSGGQRAADGVRMGWRMVYGWGGGHVLPFYGEGRKAATARSRARPAYPPMLGAVYGVPGLAAVRSGEWTRSGRQVAGATREGHKPSS